MINVMATFSTDNFTIEEIELLRSILLSKFNIQSTRVAKSSGKIQYRIRIRKSSMTNLQALWGPRWLLQCNAVSCWRRGRRPYLWYAAAADDSELCERRVPAAGHTYGTPPGSNPASFRIIGFALVLVTCSRVSS